MFEEDVLRKTKIKKKIENKNDNFVILYKLSN
jgi:hypothetical protein